MCTDTTANPDMSVRDDSSVGSQDALEEGNDADDAAECEDTSPSQLAGQLVEQLRRHHGCNVQQNGHDTPEDSTSSGVSLSDMTAWNCPDVLGKASISEYPTPWDSLLPIEERRRLYCGVTSRPEASRSSDDEEPDSRHTTIDLESDAVPATSSLHAKFDIDSAGGFASSLAVARDGFNWKAPRSSISNLRSSLHLDRLPVRWVDGRTGRLRRSQRPVHQVPHLPFGRLAGFAEVEVYLLFPGLFNGERQKWVITKDEYELWTDRIFLPAVNAACPSAVVHHLPSSAAHIEFNSTAAHVESRKGGQHDHARKQEFHFFLGPDILSELWEHVESAIAREGLGQFRDVQLLLTSKNLKLMTQRDVWSDMHDCFFARWDRAVDRRYLTLEFYDVGKEVVSPWSFLADEEPGQQPTTFSWRRCCLNRFCEWLGQLEAAQSDSSQNETGEEVGHRSTISDDATERRPRRSARLRQAINPSTAQMTADSGNDTDGGGSYQQSSDSSDSEDEDENTMDESDREVSPGTRPAEDRSRPAAWRTEFYSFSFLRDMGSMTLEPRRRSSLRRQGLLYCQFYNTSKEIFTAGNHGLFANVNLDGLALDPGLLRTWQHIGRGLSQSPLVLLKAYIHTKQRCHFALAGCRNRFYGTREEYRISGPVLREMDRIFHESNMANERLLVSSDLAPFFSHRTADVLDWVRWNVNKLCLGFELTFSLQPRTMVHWEHSRVMMMFLRCLLCGYGGQGNHIRRSNGLWLDNRVGPSTGGSETASVREGLGMETTLRRYGYAWFLDKLDWSAMTFRSPHRANMMFNTPSLQIAYHPRYRQIVESKSDFIKFHDVFALMETHRSDAIRSALLLRLLADLVLRVFRKDVFVALTGGKTRQPLDSEQVVIARKGDIPLTETGVSRVFLHSDFSDDLQFLTQARQRVTSVEVLFAWLWGWDGDGSDGDWPRMHWESKPYRVLFCQAFGVVVQTYGLQQAREWRAHVRHTFIRSHWILPYPSEKAFWSRGLGWFRTWKSSHTDVNNFYKRSAPNQRPVLDSDEIEELPVTNWTAGVTAPPLDISLPVIPTNLNDWLAAGVRNAESTTGSEPPIPLPAIGMRAGRLSQYIKSRDRSRRTLQADDDTMGSQQRLSSAWLSRHLMYHVQSMIEAQQQQIRSLDLPASIRSWQTRSRSSLIPELTSLNSDLTVEDLEGDSDTENLKSMRAHHSRRLKHLKDRLKNVRVKSYHHLETRNFMKKFRRLSRSSSSRSLSWSQWQDGVMQYRKARDLHEKASEELHRVYQETKC